MAVDDIKFNPDFSRKLKKGFSFSLVLNPIISARFLVNDNLRQISRLGLFNPLLRPLINGRNKDHPYFVHCSYCLAMSFDKVSEKRIDIVRIPRRKGQNIE